MLYRGKSITFGTVCTEGVHVFEEARPNEEHEDDDDAEGGY